MRQLTAADAQRWHADNLRWIAVIEALALGGGGAQHRPAPEAPVDACVDPKLADRSGCTPLALGLARELPFSSRGRRSVA